MATPAYAETLVEAMAHAYNTNPTLLARRAALRATDESMPQALAGWRPTVSVSADYGRANFETTRSGSRTTEALNPWTAQVQVQQPLYSGGQTTAAIKAAESTILANRADLMNTEETLLLNVATVYMNVLRDEALVELNRKNVQVLERYLQASRDRFRVGEITRTDVAQSEARLAAAQADLTSALGTLESTRATYLSVVGHAPQSLKQPDLTIDLPASREIAGQAAALANPAVVTAKYTAEAADATVDRVTGQLLPSIYLQAVAGRSVDNGAKDYQQDFAELTVNITIPLYEAGSVYSQIRQQKHTANQRRIQIHEQRRTAIQSASSAYESWVAAKASIVSLDSQISADEIALEGVEREAQVGARTVLDVLDAEKELLSARTNKVVSERNERVYAFQTLQSIGRLTAVDLSLPVEIYNPIQNYEDVRGAWFGTGANIIPEPTE
jgi:outer membrane protein